MGQFGDLWVDRDDALGRVAALVPPDLQSHVIDYIERGYTIFRGAVARAILDRVVRDTLGMFAHPERYVLKNAINNPRIYVDPTGRNELLNGDRISDLFGISGAAREATYPAPVLQFLHAMFQEPALAMQSISFEHGSQQRSIRIPPMSSRRNRTAWPLHGWRWRMSRPGAAS